MEGGAYLSDAALEDFLEKELPVPNAVFYYRSEHRCMVCYCPMDICIKMRTTCLSPAVHKMVCQLGFEIKDNIEVINIVDKDNQVCWDAICSKVYHASSGTGLDYAESVRQLGPLCETVYLYFLSLPNEKFEEAFREYFHWTNNKELFLSVPTVLKSMDGTKISLLLMKMTSCLERALGDVYLTVGKDCPFLLRDLVSSEELATIFGKSVMDVLRIFIGSPESLNLRNILWHGFVSPHEIPPKYCSMLLLFTGGLGQILQANNSGTLLVHRPYFVFNSAEELQVFPDLDEEVLSLSEKLVEESKFVLANMIPYWKEAITAFKQLRYADCAILILPQLESGLRLIFTTVNNCPDRMLTAESNTLYTTFDEILAKHLNNSSDNKVPNALGEPAMEFLWDVLNHQEGPRVRDHLSHGEIQLCDLPRGIANDLLGFSIVLLYKYCNHNTGKEAAILCPLIDALGSYRSRFHPVALLQKQVLQCMTSLQKWFLLPSPCVGHTSTTDGPDDMTDPGLSFCAEIMHVFSLLRHHRMSGFNNEEWDLQTDKWFTFMEEHCSKHFSNLYCHRSVMEVVSILRRVTAKCHLASNNIISTLKLRHEQWENKTLRSRQRQNYIRLLSSTKTLSLVIRLILTLIIVDLHNITSKMPSEYQKYLKHLKFILQYAENVSTYTNQDKNQWDEAMQLTSKIIKKIRMFFEASNLNER